jgi:hypothetical protein
MCKSLAKPLPEPAGIIARVVPELINFFPISFTDPSPPTATIISNLSELFFEISIPCLALSVYFISTVN